ncbi:plasmid pRiA4b ORF-3 family protein [Hoeflea sp. 108]|uniref:plasmid pRiA4b ORF-3 family protein n=1 Tax=Hoeflea sp. 108 TaxID=1116369 RepID=UPI0012F96498|nr:plasmid pRiA4b ORF-3 family protein [Hoeflea sp. 108]
MPSTSPSLPTSTGSILQLKIRLLGLSPMVWRRVLVPESYSLRELHGVIQVAMGWESLHLFEFRIRAVRYGSSDICTEPPDKTLDSFGFRKNAKFAYVYDMGDWWEHEVRVEDREVAKERGRYPVCVGGAGACPPEDCGGPDRYLARRDDALGPDTMDDLATMADFVEQVVFNGNRAMLDDDEARQAVERAIDRSRSRAPFLACRFSLRDVNTGFRQDEHRRLMYQWLI